MADRTDGTDRTEDQPYPRRRRATKETVKRGFTTFRARLASLIWLVAIIAALFLAAGAMTVALKLNLDNGIVHFVNQVAGRIDFGQFKRFTGTDAAERTTLTNWGAAALIYL
ncbi:MAG: hypothetical protein ACRDVE_07605, partial [Actinocrinis sp.]